MLLHVQLRSQTAHAPPLAPLDDAPLLLAPLDEPEAPDDALLPPLDDELLLAPLEAPEAPDDALPLAPDEPVDPELAPLAPLDPLAPESDELFGPGSSKPVWPPGSGDDGSESSGVPPPDELPAPVAPTAQAAAAIPRTHPAMEAIDIDDESPRTVRLTPLLDSIFLAPP